MQPYMEHGQSQMEQGHIAESANSKPIVYTTKHDTAHKVYPKFPTITFKLQKNGQSITKLNDEDASLTFPCYLIDTLLVSKRS